MQQIVEADVDNSEEVVISSFGNFLKLIWRIGWSVLFSLVYLTLILQIFSSSKILLIILINIKLTLLCLLHPPDISTPDVTEVPTQHSFKLSDYLVIGNIVSFYTVNDLLYNKLFCVAVF